MRNSMTKIGLGTAALLLLLAVASQPVQAACAFPGILATTESASAASQIMTADFYAASAPSPYGYAGAFYAYNIPPFDAASLEGSWWAIGTGNPAFGAGDDNGTFDAARWIQVYSGAGPGGTFYYGGYFATGWGATAEVDGCINNNTTGCTCILLTTNGPGEPPRFALLGAQGNSNFDAFFNLPGNAPIVLADLPTPVIQTSSRDVNNDLTLGVGVTDASAGVYQQDMCNCALSFRVREIVQARGLEPPMDRDSAAWDGAANPVDAVDASSSVFSSCGATDTDVWLATELVVDPASAGGFASPVVSDLGTRIECGPNVADPKPVKERPTPVARPNPRGSRSGR